jgi:hypothetical protein
MGRGEMKKSRLIGLFAVLAAAIVVIGGCGNSEDAAGTTAASEQTTPELTKAQFVKQANAICAKGNEELNKGFQRFLKQHNVPEGQPPSPKQLGEVAETIVVPVVGNQIEEIRALGAPSGEEEQVETFLAAAEAGVEKSEKEPKSLLNAKGSPFEKANELARESGLRACSE